MVQLRDLVNVTTTKFKVYLYDCETGETKEIDVSRGSYDYYEVRSQGVDYATGIIEILI